MVTLDTKTHTYKKGRVKYTPVSTILELYRVPFDTDHWSTYKAYQEILGDDFKAMASGFNPSNPDLFKRLAQVVENKEMGKVRDRIKKEWRDGGTKSAKRGTKYHKDKENSSYEYGYEVNPFSGEKYRTVGRNIIKGPRAKKFDLFSLPDGYYPELIIWNDEYKIAGTPDRLFVETVGDIRYIDIDDYKTVKKIDTKNKHQRFLKPLDHLEDTRYNKYRLQVSFYAWMLEQVGFTVRHTAFTHINQQYSFTYDKASIKLIIKDFKRKLASKKK
jgi:hypothetical protein